ncbi:tyrosine-protein phosphatase [Flavobacterium sp. GT3R68]|uniref:tyrosine-protein phosphatase n=1 Tax=Flavobacterium sp. GT3R68 TaxID=2594437 RepID=UPI000F8950FF|nr:CpsB/CapC family capsule biosynthesis tyrosine phosphatase [Flavobacterium sp. GT3R68]RTY92286.1 histidinol phosphatase [Flavobacterium sp. GSN2]TRW92522.1 histidinol phosphatase [Flavobacterium sp. GT3R68]
MISLFKSKPILADLIPEGYVDIHSHVLFGIDDGAQNSTESEFLLQAMIGLRFAKCITTPHTMKHVWENTREGIVSRLDDLRDALPDLTTKLNLAAASEYLIDNDLIVHFQSEPLLTLKDNYVLVEMSYLNPPMQLHEILFQLQVEGYIPVLAHPERYTFYHNDFRQYEKLKKTGCLFQLNLLSTVGYYGKGVAETAQKLLQKGMIDFAGSDIHHKKHVEAFAKKVIIKESKSLIEVMGNNSIFK